MADEKNTAEAAPGKPEASKAAGKAASTIPPMVEEVISVGDEFVSGLAVAGIQLTDRLNKRLGAIGVHSMQDFVQQGTSWLDALATKYLGEEPKKPVEPKAAQKAAPATKTRKKTTKKKAT